MAEAARVPWLPSEKADAEAPLRRGKLPFTVTFISILNHKDGNQNLGIKSPNVSNSKPQLAEDR